MLHPAEQSELAFYITVPSACNYLPNRKAVTVFADPFAGMTKATNEFGENLQGSPAVAGNAMFVRSDKHLWKISESK